ncbi:ABC-2 transporter permease [Eggerthellaceae bacterium 24-137]
MKTMIVSDFAILRPTLIQLAGICAVVALAMGYATGSVASGAAAIAAMTPFMLLFSLAAIDEQGGWERFRLTLPITRRQVVFGRYATLGTIALGTIAFALALSFGVLAVLALLPAAIVPEGLAPAENPPAAIIGGVVGGVCVIMVGMAVALPLIMRFGMTKATRIVPAVVVIFLALGVGFFGSGIQPTGVLADFVQWLDAGSNYLVAAALITLAATAVYVVSALVAAKLYERRAF